MKEILAAIKAQLPGQVSSLVSIGIIPDENMLPEEMRLPFVGLKDGPIVGDDELDPLTWYWVEGFCYVEVAKPEASIMGDAATGAVGILDFTDAVKAGFTAIGRLGISSIVEMRIDPSQPASELGQLDEGFIQRKKIRVGYCKNI